MNAVARQTILRGAVSVDGRLCAADPELEAMQVEAGGKPDGPLMLPPLAQLVRVALRLGTVIARPLVLNGVSFWARLKPQADGVEIALVEQGPFVPLQTPEDGNAEAVHAEMALGGWRWEVDGRLQFTVVDTTSPLAPAAPPKLGEPLPSYFRLSADEADGALPILAGLAGRRPFVGQRAVSRAAPDVPLVLSGIPVFQANGSLAGFRGQARPLTTVSSQQPGAPEAAVSVAGWGDAAFGRKLEEALRLPLDRILANARSITGQTEGPLRADYVAYASDIAAAGRHLLELVEDLADLQAIERPDFATARERLDLADLARQATGLLKLRAGEHAITIEAPKADESVLATGEYRRALQILVNLIGNAVRYSPDQSHIWVRVDEDVEAGMACVIVADQGRGIDPADQEQIFERFHRVNPDEGTGSGLGLYISRRLAHAMGGDIRVESALGQGARFTLLLPMWGAPS